MAEVETINPLQMLGTKFKVRGGKGGDLVDTICTMCKSHYMWNTHFLGGLG